MNWREQAEAFYRLSLRHGYGPCPEVAGWLRQHRHRPGRPGVACSGGADSLALLLWLYGAWHGDPVFTNHSQGQGNAARPSAAAQRAVGQGAVVQQAALAVPVVLHLDHGLRGEASAADAAFVQEVASALGWPFLGGHARDFGGGATLPSPSEAQLRDWRQTFFAASGCTHIFQGHHRGDVAETMLMRLCRGSGLAGLAAPRPVSTVTDVAKTGKAATGSGEGAAVSSAPRRPLVYLRPLLDWDKGQLTAWLRQLGINWREDASNAEGVYFRNRLRANVLPALSVAAQGRDVAAAFARSREQLQADAQALEFWLEQLWSAACHRADSTSAAGLVLQWSVFAPLPRAMRQRALRRFVAAYNVGDSLSAAAVEAMLDELEPYAAAVGIAPQSPEGGAGAVAGSRLAAHTEELRFSLSKDYFLLFDPRRLLLSVSPAAAWHERERRRVAFAAANPVAGGKQSPLAAVAVLTPGSTLYLPNTSGSIRLDCVAVTAELLAKVRGGEVPCARQVYLHWSAAAALPEEAVRLGLRFWLPGDLYRPLGAPGRRKLQDCFTDWKIPPQQRHALPLVTDLQGDEVLWVAGCPPAHRLALANRTKWALMLTYTPSRKTVASY